jgi:hypothetical protein
MKSTSIMKEREGNHGLRGLDHHGRNEKKHQSKDGFPLAKT